MILEVNNSSSTESHLQGGITNMTPAPAVITAPFPAALTLDDFTLPPSVSKAPISPPRAPVPAVITNSSPTPKLIVNSPSDVFKTAPPGASTGTPLPQGASTSSPLAFSCVQSATFQHLTPSPSKQRDRDSILNDPIYQNTKSGPKSFNGSITLAANNMACRLAEYYYGKDVLANSTVSGKVKGLLTLDPRILEILLSDIKNFFGMRIRSPQELEDVLKACKTSIQQKGKYLRRSRQEFTPQHNTGPQVATTSAPPPHGPSTGSPPPFSCVHSATPQHLTPTSPIKVRDRDSILNDPIYQNPNSFNGSTSLAATNMACKLAEFYFGNEVLASSTVSGKNKGLLTLDPRIMEILLSDIKNFFITRISSAQELEDILKACKTSIQQKGKHLRRNQKEK